MIPATLDHIRVQYSLPTTGAAHIHCENVDGRRQRNVYSCSVGIQLTLEQRGVFKDLFEVVRANGRAV